MPLFLTLTQKTGDPIRINFEQVTTYEANTIGSTPVTYIAFGTIGDPQGEMYSVVESPERIDELLGMALQARYKNERQVLVEGLSPTVNLLRAALQARYKNERQVLVEGLSPTVNLLRGIRLKLQEIDATLTRSEGKLGDIQKNTNPSDEPGLRRT